MGDTVPQHIWKGLFEWSMQQQGDGTREPRPMSETDREWLEQALKSAMVDLGKRMQDIKESLDASEAAPEAAAGGGAAGSAEAGTGAVASLEEKEQLLDELMDLVESIDLARDLSTIGGLQTLLDLLGSQHPSLRWRAAEVAATCVQNNPPVQKAFMEGGIMPRLLPLLDDSNSTVQTKALMAISCMVRGYPPALLLLRQQGGLATLIGLLGGQPEVRLQRKCLQVLQYILRVMPLDRRSAYDDGLLRALSSTLGSDDNDVREAALLVAQQVAADDDCLRLMQQDSGFRQALESLSMRLDTLPKEEWEVVQDEVAATKQLAAALQRELPPPAAPAGTTAAGATQARTLPAAVVDDSSTSGVPAAALQLVAVPQPAPTTADHPPPN